MLYWLSKHFIYFANKQNEITKVGSNLYDTNVFLSACFISWPNGNARSRRLEHAYRLALASQTDSQVHASCPKSHLNATARDVIQYFK